MTKLTKLNVKAERTAMRALWDGGSKITDAERESIKKCIGDFFQKIYGIELHAV
jgi:hypothetical protein